MEIRKLALILKEDIKPPYYAKLGDNVEFFLFNDTNVVRFDIEKRTQIIESERHIEFYKEPRTCNIDFFRLVKDEDSKR